MNECVFIYRTYHQIAEEESLSKPFGPKQIIVVGEFLQLRPVPGTFDDGDFVFRCELFQKAISHRFELRTMMRQSLGDTLFINALKELRLGLCGQETKALLTSLNREIAGESVHVYFTKLSVHMQKQEPCSIYLENFSHLMQLMKVMFLASAVLLMSNSF